MRHQFITLLAGAALTSGAAFAGQAHWGYTGQQGPEHWGQLAPEYALCTSGKNQSPVNLSGFVEAQLSDIGFDDPGQATEILNNGHTVQINYTPGSTIEVDGHQFELKQFHFHSPSENRVDGRSYPLEAHFVHADKDGNLAVVAVLFEKGAQNAVLAKLWARLPGQEGGAHALMNRVRAIDLLPEDRTYYRFDGSLTTPPCTEGVLWLVLKTAVHASPAQIEAFVHTLHHPNNRPVQALNARAVLE